MSSVDLHHNGSHQPETPYMKHSDEIFDLLNGVTAHQNASEMAVQAQSLLLD